MSFLERAISPPPPRKRASSPTERSGRPTKRIHVSAEVEQDSCTKCCSRTTSEGGATCEIAMQQDKDIKVVRSPIRLYSVKDLPGSENIDTVTLGDILSPQCTLDEIWSFNYMTDLPWFRRFLGKQHEKRVKVR